MNYKIKISQLRLFCLCVFVVRPYYVQIIPMLNSLWIAATIACLLWSSYAVVKHRLFRYVKTYALFLAILIFSTFFNHMANVGSAISSAIQVLLACNIGLMILTSNKQPTSSLRCIRNVFVAYLAADAVAGILNVSSLLGLSDTLTLLGYDNYAIYNIIPMLAVVAGVDFYLYKKLSKGATLLWLLCLVYKIVTVSINACMMLLIYGFIMFIGVHIRGFRKLISIKNAVIFTVAAFVGVYFFKIQELFVSLLVSMGKGTTLGFRTVIWARAVPAILKQFWFGYGYLNAGEFQPLVGLSSVWDTEANHCHNLFLEIIFTTGIIGFIVFVMAMRKNLRTIQRANMMLPLTPMVVGMIVYFLMGFLDGYPYTVAFYVMMSLATSLSVYELRKETCVPEKNAGFEHALGQLMPLKNA